jgi:hypothetical protein
MMLTSDIISRLCQSNIVDSLDRNVMEKYLSGKFINHNTTLKPTSEIAIDRIVSQKLMFHIQEFFHMTTVYNKTQKVRKYSIGKFTRKRQLPSCVRTP